MLANYAEFFMFGGALYHNDDIYEDPDPDYVLGYQLYKYGPDKPAWDRGFDDKALPDKIDRFVAYGAAVSAPSENKAWYFSGMRSPSGGEIYSNLESNRTYQAQNITHSMVELDMEIQWSEEWTNKTLPPEIKGRANAEAVWVPVGEQGILVVLGGVVYPEWSQVSHKSEDKEASVSTGPP